MPLTHLSVQSRSDHSDDTRGIVDGEHIGLGQWGILAEDAVPDGSIVGVLIVISVRGGDLHNGGSWVQEGKVELIRLSYGN